MALGYALVGYVAGAVIAYVAVQVLSGNVHDRDLEAAMTAAFVGGPALAVVGAVTGAIRGGRPPRRSQPA
jgi:ABC-type transport system involved in cytochrome c biogenesis permease component